MNPFRSFSVARLLALAFGIAVVIPIAQSSMGFVVAGMFRTLVQTNIENAHVNFDLSIQVRELIQSEELHLRRMSVLIDSKSIEEEASQANEDGNKLELALSKIASQPLSSEDQSFVKELQRLQSSVKPDRVKVIELAKAMQTDQANAIFDQQIDPVSIRMRSLALNLSVHQRESLNLTFKEMDLLAEQTRLYSVLSALLGAPAILLAGVTLYRAIAPPFKEALRVANTIASGDLTIEIHSTDRNELGTMMRAMNAMSSKMRDAISHIGDASRSILRAAGEIADGNSDLSARTERQVAALMSASRAVSEISNGVNENADSSRGAKQQAQEAALVATTGGKNIGQLTGTMNAISQSSKRIVEIVSVIDSIAFQTNILALNAAVEAARAGEQGRGFAVVASEVRTLAKRSADSAREIRELVDTNLRTVSAGVTQVNEASTTMQAIVQSSEKVSLAISEISRASDRQAENILDVQLAMNELDDGVKLNSTLVEEATLAAESLKLQTLNMNAAINLFKVRATEVNEKIAQTSTDTRRLDWEKVD